MRSTQKPMSMERTEVLDMMGTLKQARSIQYQMTIAKLPLAKDVDDFAFKGTPINGAWCATAPAATSSPNSATWSWSAAPVPARRIWP
jgi:hypothetical protein